MRIKRFLSLLLAALLLVSLLPTAWAEDSEPVERTVTPGAPEAPAPDTALWAQIEQLESAHLERRRTSQPTVQDFAALSADVAELVCDSADYAEDSLFFNGASVFWRTADGVACGYSPRLRAELYQSAGEPEVPEEERNAVVTDSYATRGGYSGSADVTVLQPYYGIDENIKVTYANEGRRIAKAVGGRCSVYTGTSATIDAVASALQNSGVVIFDSHGDTDYVNPNNSDDFVSRANTSYLVLSNGSGITDADMQQAQGTYGKYYHAYYGGRFKEHPIWYVDGTAISNHMRASNPNGMLWMAICLGMATEGLYKPLRSRGVETVYGYSQSVSFSGDYTFEKYFWDRMIAGYTVGSAISYMRTKAGCSWDPAYKKYNLSAAQAKQYYLAFPVVVSSEDAYPGRGRVDSVQKVSSAWKLVTPYTGCPDCPGRSFSDMPMKSNWAHDPIDWAVSQKITSGTSATTFSPDAKCTRAQVVTFLWRAFGSPTPLSTAQPFRDVAGNDYFRNAVLWAVENGITAGTSATTFSPKNPCTRAQVVTFLWRAKGKPQPTSRQNPFRDVAANEYYIQAVLWAVENQVTAGTSATTFSPKDPCTRAQVVTFLYRASQIPGAAGSTESRQRVYTWLEEFVRAQGQKASDTVTYWSVDLSDSDYFMVYYDADTRHLCSAVVSKAGTDKVETVMVFTPQMESPYYVNTVYGAVFGWANLYPEAYHDGDSLHFTGFEGESYLLAPLETVYSSQYSLLVRCLQGLIGEGGFTLADLGFTGYDGQRAPDATLPDLAALSGWALPAAAQDDGGAVRSPVRE